jgi:hypothetical protein
MSASPKAKEWTAGLSSSAFGEKLAGSIILRSVFRGAAAKVRNGIGERISRSHTQNSSNYLPIRRTNGRKRSGMCKGGEGHNDSSGIHSCRYFSDSGRHEEAVAERFPNVTKAHSFSSVVSKMRSCRWHAQGRGGIELQTVLIVHFALL